MPSLGRRELLQWLGTVAAASALPGLGCFDEDGNELVPAGAFFTVSERNALAALTNVVLPPDDTPGAAALGAALYIEALLLSLDGATPMVFAGGPYSGRQPFATADGAASTQFPPNDFTTFQPLDRVTLAAWKLRLFGSSGVPRGAPNEGILGPVVGLRDQIRQGIASARAQAPAPLESLGPDALADVWSGLDGDFRSAVTELVCEAAWSAPEYGGNAKLAGWKLIHFEGDSQPLGYSLYDTTLGGYRERQDAPMSTQDVGPDPEPMDSDTTSFVSLLIALAGGQEFA